MRPSVPMQRCAMLNSASSGHRRIQIVRDRRRLSAHHSHFRSSAGWLISVCPQRTKIALRRHNLTPLEFVPGNVRRRVRRRLPFRAALNRIMPDSTVARGRLNPRVEGGAAFHARHAVGREPGFVSDRHGRAVSVSDLKMAAAARSSVSTRLRRHSSRIRRSNRLARLRLSLRARRSANVRSVSVVRNVI